MTAVCGSRRTRCVPCGYHSSGGHAPGRGRGGPGALERSGRRAYRKGGPRSQGRGLGVPPVVLREGKGPGPGGGGGRSDVRVPAAAEKLHGRGHRRDPLPRRPLRGSAGAGSGAGPRGAARRAGRVHEAGVPERAVGFDPGRGGVGPDPVTHGQGRGGGVGPDGRRVVAGGARAAGTTGRYARAGGSRHRLPGRGDRAPPAGGVGRESRRGGGQDLGPDRQLRVGTTDS